MQQFNSARQTYNQGNMKKAAQILTSIIKKYPAHQPSLVLMGKILYRSRMYSRAAQYFKRTDPGSLDSDTAYEYGISLFVAKDCKNALAGFRYVQPASKWKGISNFYTGVCYIKTNNLQQARMALLSAKRIPRGLIRSKHKLLKMIQDKMALEDKGFGYNNNISLFYAPPPQNYAQPLPPVQTPSAQPNEPTPTTKKDEKDKGKTKAKEKAKAKPEKPKEGSTTEITPQISYKTTDKRQEFHGYKVGQGNDNEIKLGLDFNWAYFFSPDTSFLIGLGAEQAQKISTGKDLQNKAYENDPTTVFVSVEDKGRNEETISKGSAKPGFSFKVTDAVESQLKGEYIYMMKKATEEQDITQRAPIINLGISFTDKLSLDLTAEYREFLNSQITDKDKQKKIGDILVVDSTTGKAEITWALDNISISAGTTYHQYNYQVPGWNIDFSDEDGSHKEDSFLKASLGLTRTWDTFSISTTAKYMQKDPGKDPLTGLEKDFDGPMDSEAIEASAKKTYEAGLTLTLTGSYTMYGEYRKTGLDAPASSSDSGDSSGEKKKVTAVATGSQKKGSFVMKYAPFEWIYGSVNFNYGITDYVVKDPALAAAFQKSTADLSQDFSMEVGLSKKF